MSRTALSGYMRDNRGKRLDEMAVAPQAGPTVVVVGDSLTEQGGMVSGAPQIKTTSPWPWAMNLLGQRFRVLYNAGIGGQTTSQILARFQTDVIAYDPDVAVILAGTNNMGSGTAQAKADITAMLDLCERNGIRAVLCTIPPRISGSYSGTMRADTYELNRWIIATTRQRRGVILADLFSVLASNGGNYYGTITGKNPTADGVHLSAQGGFVAGQELARALETLAPANFPYQPVAPNLLPYPSFTLGAAGSAPSNWTVSGSGSPTWTQPARPGMPSVPWKQGVIANGTSLQLSQNVNIGATLAVGDYVSAYVEYEALSLDQAAAAGSQALMLRLRFWNGSSYFSTMASMEDYNSPADDRSGAFYVQPVQVPATTTIVAMDILAISGGTYRFARPGVYKSASYDTP